MEQFKKLPYELRYQYAYNWLLGYLEAASERTSGLPQDKLRLLLDRMERFANVRSGATFEADPLKPLELVPDQNYEYHYAWLMLIGFLEAAHYFRGLGLKQRDLWDVLDKMERFAGIEPVPRPIKQ